MNKKGFTLIELLITIAIIGILAGILFVAINPKEQTDKAKNAKIKTELTQARTQASLLFSSNQNFENLCNGNAVNLSATCGSNYSAWAVGKTLADVSSNWCTDSSGYSGPTITSHEDGDIICIH